jgi:hypothetical protein
MLLPLSRLTETYHALRPGNPDPYERVHQHARDRWRVGAISHAQRPKRPGIAWQQLRANASVLIEWLLICWRQGWLDGIERNSNEIITGTGAKGLAGLIAFRRAQGLDRRLGPKATLGLPTAPGSSATATSTGTIPATTTPDFPEDDETIEVEVAEAEPPARPEPTSPELIEKLGFDPDDLPF